MNCVYDPVKAKQQVQNIWTKLQAMNTRMSTLTGDALTRESITAAQTEYLTFPITYQINWEIIDVKPEDAQKVADSLRDKVREAGATLGSNKHIPRLFNAEEED